MFVTHDQEEAFEIADEIVLINRGRIEQIGIPNEIYDHPNSKFVASFIGHVNVLECHAKNGGIFLCRDGADDSRNEISRRRRERSYY